MQSYLADIEFVSSMFLQQNNSRQRADTKSVVRITTDIFHDMMHH